MSPLSVRPLYVYLQAYKSNESYRTVTILGVIHRLDYFFKNTTFRRLDSVSVVRWNLLRWARWKEVALPVSGD
jgi:hypothetical protein